MSHDQCRSSELVGRTEVQTGPFDTSDSTIRAALLESLHELHSGDIEYMIIEELGLNHGSVRADVAVLNGAMECYEIKSDRDNLSRLPNQVHAYNAVFDRVTIVVGRSHVIEAIESIPDWWGVTLAKQNHHDEFAVSLNTIRHSRQNPLKDRGAIAKLLWREEALKILQDIGLAAGFKSKTRKAMYEVLVNALDVECLSERVRLMLCSRDYWRVA